MHTYTHKHTYAHAHIRTHAWARTHTLHMCTCMWLYLLVNLGGYHTSVTRTRPFALRARMRIHAYSGAYKHVHDAGLCMGRHTRTQTLLKIACALKRHNHMQQNESGCLRVCESAGVRESTMRVHVQTHANIHTWALYILKAHTHREYFHGHTI
jgi:hypothetical protein